eukprot:6468691-Amphidinium_carterae.1
MLYGHRAGSRDYSFGFPLRRAMQELTKSSNPTESKRVDTEALSVPLQTGPELDGKMFCRRLVFAPPHPTPDCRINSKLHRSRPPRDN